MMRVEAVIFAASQPVSRETLCAVIGNDCNLDLLIAAIRDELKSRPYELVDVAGGYQHRTRRAYAEVIRASGTVAAKGVDLTRLEKLVLTAVAYFQPVTRAGLGDILGRKISRDAIAALRGADLIATGPRSPQPGAPHTYVTTPAFLGMWGLASLRHLPERVSILPGWRSWSYFQPVTRAGHRRRPIPRLRSCPDFAPTQVEPKER
jgi:segregation and condensation protein B